MVRYIAQALAASLLLAPLACSHGEQNAKGVTEAQAQKELPKVTEELRNATTALQDLTKGENVPMEQRDRARCVVVVPNMGRFALVIGGQHGEGVVSCRTENTEMGWSAPAFITMSGGSIGAQVGGQSSDILMLATTHSAVNKLFSGNVKMGAGLSVAAGPTGTGKATSPAEFLVYAQRQGLFAGVDVNGVGSKAHEARMAALYGPNADPMEVLSGHLQPPPETHAFLRQLQASFPPHAAPVGMR